MQLNYNSIQTDQSYIGRVFLFVQRNYWLFLVDIIVLLFLVIPPYNWYETRMLLIAILLLFFRDLIILKIGWNHLGKFIAKGNEVSIGILKGSKLKVDIMIWLPDIELEVKYCIGMPVLHIMSGNEVVFKQYMIGIWTIDKMKEFIDSFYDYKKEQALWKIYKGQE